MVTLHIRDFVEQNGMIVTRFQLPANTLGALNINREPTFLHQERLMVVEHFSIRLQLTVKTTLATSVAMFTTYLLTTDCHFLPIDYIPATI